MSEPWPPSNKLQFQASANHQQELSTELVTDSSTNFAIKDPKRDSTSSTPSAIESIRTDLRLHRESRWAHSLAQISSKLPSQVRPVLSKQERVLQELSSRTVQQRYLERVQKFSERCPESLPLLSYLQDYLQAPQILAEKEDSSTVVMGGLFDESGREMIDLNCSPLENFDTLIDTLKQPTTKFDYHTRLIIAPDLSPPVISLLGEAFEINPLVFASALRDVNLGNKVSKSRIRMPYMESHFGSGLFSYECESDVTAGFTCTSDKVDFEEWSAGVTSPETIHMIDASIKEQFNKGAFVSSPLIEPDPFLSKAVLDHSTRTVDIVRTFRTLNRLTCYHVDQAAKPTFLLLGTPLNNQLDEDLVAYEGRTWIDDLTDGTPTQIIDYELRGKGNSFLYRLLGDRTLCSVWKTVIWMKSAPPADGAVPSSGWSADLLDDVSLAQRKNPREEEVTILILNLRASMCALESFEQTAHRASEKMQNFRGSHAEANVSDTNALIALLRKYRYALMNSRERLVAHTRDFERSIETSNLEDELKAELRLKDHLKELKETENTFQTVINRNEQITQDCLFDLQIQLAQTQLEESRRSIQQNDTVRRLTVLAFIFVPVSTVSSVFGMNVRGIDDVQPWKFATTLVLVLLFVLLLAQYQSVVALLSAVEATAFDHATLTSPISQFTGRQGLRSGLRESLRTIVSVFSHALVAFFAIISLLLVPLKYLVYQLKLAIQYGVKQQDIHRERRLDLAESSGQAMMRESIDDWLQEMRDRHWCYRAFWRCMFLPAVAFAFVMHHLAPLPYDWQGKRRSND